MVKAKRNFVEIGRVIYVRFGKNKDTLAVITDIIDHNWIFADGRAFPNGMKRGPLNIKDIALTHMKLKMGHGLRHRHLKELVAKEDILNKWKKTTIARRLEKQKNKLNSTDLERWRIQYNRRQRSSLIKVKFNKLKKKALQTARRLFGKKNPIPFADRKKPKKQPRKSDKPKPENKGRKLTDGERKKIKKCRINYKALAGYQLAVNPGQVSGSSILSKIH
mgnify:CR=1 FL=1